MSWVYDLRPASFRGVRFEVKKVTDGIAKRRWARQPYPYVDGEDIDDLGREAWDSNITAVFVGPDYLTRLSDLIQVCKDGKAGLFVHPLLGNSMARCSIERIDHDENFRDGCLVELTVVEDGSGGDVEPVQSVYAITVELETVLDEVTSAVDAIADALEAIGDAVDQVQDAVDSAREFIDDATSSVTRAVNSMNKTIKKVQKAIDSAVKLGDVESYEVVSALRRTERTVQKLSERVMGDKWPLREFTVVAPVPAVLLAQMLYQDASRADELCEMNAGLVRNPFMVPAGVTLQIFNS